MIGKAFVVVVALLICLVRETTCSKSFTADFRVTASPFNHGYFDGSLSYDWDANAMVLQFPFVGLYSELYKFNSYRGYNPSLLNGQFYGQFQFKTSKTCSCETTSFSYTMPAFYQTNVNYGTTAVAAWIDTTNTVVVNGQDCKIYTPNPKYQDVSFVTEYAETAAGVPCRFTTADKRTFTLSNVKNGAIAASTFTPPSGCKCGKPIDIVVSLDRSGSIAKWEWDVEQAFVRNLTKAFEFGPLKTNMGILNWNINRWTTIPLIQGDSYDNVNKAVEAMKCCSANLNPGDSCCCCGTPIGGGVRAAGVEMLTSSRAATKVIIVLTDGCQNHIYDADTDKATPCSCPSEQACATNGPCHDDLVTHYNWVNNNIKGVKILVIGVGGAICPTQLQLVSGNHPENVFTATSWEQLSSFVESITATACTVSENPCVNSCCGICSCGACITPVNCTAPDVCTKVALDPLSQCCVTSPVVCPGKTCNDDACDTKNGCKYSPVQCTQLNNCSDYSCDPAQNVCVGTPNGKCVPPPECIDASKCDDSRACTIDTCVNSKCVHTPVTCESNKCVTSTCNTLTGKCDKVLTNCDDRDACTTDSCDVNTGCVNAKVTCDARKDKCELSFCDKLIGCTFQRMNCTQSSDNCTIWTCDAGVCKNVSICKPPPENQGTEVVQAVAISLGAAALVGIIIAIVAVLGACAGGGAYAYAQQGDHSAATQVGNNPLYQGTEVNTQNPLFKAH